MFCEWRFYFEKVASGLSVKDGQTQCCVCNPSRLSLHNTEMKADLEPAWFNFHRVIIIIINEKENLFRAAHTFIHFIECSPFRELYFSRYPCPKGIMVVLKWGSEPVTCGSCKCVNQKGALLGQNDSTGVLSQCQLMLPLQDSWTREATTCGRRSAAGILPW